MKILIVGSGGREHTIAWKLAQNPEVTDLYVAPGNAGTAALGTNVRIDPSDLEGLKNFVKENSVDLTMVGPEQPLVDGIVDAFQNENLSIFGPRQNAAQLEGSKAFAKDFMHRHNIPTAGYQTFSDYEKALTYLHTLSPPLVVKASGLAAGKGVIICHTQEEAEQTAHEIMVDRKFGAAGAEVVIEEFLDGEELSIIAITDGNAYKLLVPSQDHKPVYDGDEGPNTGGMGAYAPAPAATPNLIREVEEKIIVPTLQGMKSEQRPYMGFLYCGLILTNDGPQVLEFNCRLGDPEAQVILPLLKSDLLEIIQAVMAWNLENIEVEITEGFATCVVASSGGYPVSYEKGREITGLEEVNSEYCQVFHAGTSTEDGNIFTDGGRVLGVTCTGRTLQESIDRTYTELGKIHFEKMHFRTDIAQKGLGHL